VTANLVRLKLRVSPQFIHPLPLGVTQLIDDVEVTLLNANQWVVYSAYIFVKQVKTFLMGCS